MASIIGNNNKPAEANTAESDSAGSFRVAVTQKLMAPLGNEQQITGGGSQPPRAYPTGDRMFLDDGNSSSHFNRRYSGLARNMNTRHVRFDDDHLKAASGYDSDYAHHVANDVRLRQGHRHMDNMYDRASPSPPGEYDRAPIHQIAPHLRYGLEPHRPVTYRQETPVVGPPPSTHRVEDLYDFEAELSDGNGEENKVPQNRRRTVSRDMNLDRNYQRRLERFSDARDNREPMDDDYDGDDSYNGDENYKDDDGYEDDDESCADTEAPQLRRQSARKSTTRATRHPATRPDHVQPGSEFGMANNKRISRYAGISIKAGVNKVPFRAPQPAPQAPVTKQSRTRKGDDSIVKRASGANDPENILIVNMFENDGMRWCQIAQILNEMRVKAGRVPNFTSNSVHNRYNRNAPLLFAAEGKIWVPICERGETRLPSDPVTVWTAELDQELIRITKKVEGAKWATVAKILNQENGLNITAMAAAQRHLLM